MAGVVVHTRLLVLLKKVFLQCDLSSADEVTARLIALVHRLVDVYLHVTLDTALGLAREVTEVAAERLLLHMFVLDVSGQGAGGGAGHVTVGTLVVINM